MPLIVKLPRRSEPRLIGEWVSIIDVAPTILRLTGRENPPGMPLEGASLTRPPAGRALFGQTRRLHVKDTVVLNGWKLIHNLRTRKRELFDLAHDPGERRNRIAQEPELADALEDLLEEWRERMKEAATKVATEEPEYTPEEIEMLRALGYTQ